MASSVPSYINFRSLGTSGHLTRYADGSFLTVWTEFSRNGDAYVYGKAFKADGTTLRDAFLIDHAPSSASASYSEITATTLSNGRAVVAWIKSDGTRSVVGKVLGADFSLSSGLLQLSQGVTSPDTPQVHALQNGGFNVLFRGPVVDQSGESVSGLWTHSLMVENGAWVTTEQAPLHAEPNDPSNATVVLRNGTHVAVLAEPEGGETQINVYIRNGDDWTGLGIDRVPNVTSGINPAISPIGTNTFVVAWEDVEGAGRIIRAQIVDVEGNIIGTANFTKPNGTLEGTPVIQQLEGGGFAIAFVVETNGDENLYTAAATANGTIIANTMPVGTNTAGDQWDPSLIPLSGHTYAVSWQSNGEAGGPQYIVEVIGVAGTPVTTPTIPNPNTNPNNPNDPNNPTQSTAWNGTSGNDAYTGTSASETLKGWGGRDIIDGAAGDDKLWGGLGNDSLKGGDGLDIFVFDTRANTKTNKDMIADFKAKDDTIWLDNKVFAKLGKAGSEKKPVQLKKDFFTIGSKAKDKNDYVIYDKSKGKLYYDADGSGKGKAVEFASLSKKLVMTHKDFFVI
ncbi:Ca2+-binding RTX toxin-like protein [Microvirga lupini]|uniref:Ca2+-binding RTX toxin-like protein n=1 Tax=Microvirga lupini TaxID=420324 RepID=A0A7W4VLP2_9HYPH|nr:calcium-binding protein [Microvirga lupini]MBB3019035.1 Ca2+-binding RTX toxin-like protein [Microvirga lupini]